MTEDSTTSSYPFWFPDGAVNPSRKGNPLWGSWISETGSFTRSVGWASLEETGRVLTSSGDLLYQEALANAQRFCPPNSILLGITGFAEDVARISTLGMAIMERLIVPNFFSPGGDEPTPEVSLAELDSFLRALGMRYRLGMVCRMDGPFLLRKLSSSAEFLPVNILSALLHEMAKPEFEAHNAAQYLLSSCEREGGYTREAFRSAREAEHLYRKSLESGHPAPWAVKMVRNKTGLDAAS